MYPQNEFFRFKSDGMGGFEEKTWKLYSVPHPPPQKKSNIHFCRLTPRSFKNGHAP